MLAGALQSIENEPPKGNIAATYDYTNEEGDLLYQSSGLSRKAFVSAGQTATADGYGRQGLPPRPLPPTRTVEVPGRLRLRLRR
jgi:hypothetical protein